MYASLAWLYVYVCPFRQSSVFLQSFSRSFHCSREEEKGNRKQEKVRIGGDEKRMEPLHSRILYSSRHRVPLEVYQE